MTCKLLDISLLQAALDFPAQPQPLGFDLAHPIGQFFQFEQSFRSGYFKSGGEPMAQRIHSRTGLAACRAGTGALGRISAVGRRPDR